MCRLSGWETGQLGSEPCEAPGDDETFENWDDIGGEMNSQREGTYYPVGI